MIKVKLYSEDEYRNQNRPLEPGVIEYNRSCFRMLMWRPYDADPKPPFRDAESIKFLRDFNIEFAPDEWYSVLEDGERMPLSELGPYLMYGLCVIDYSRRGRYISYYSVSDKVWRSLAGMPFDILIGLPVARISEYGYEVMGKEKFLILNYPYNQGTVEVICGDICVRDEFCVRLSDSEECGTLTGLYIGRDGEYYCDRWGLGDAFRYYWKNDVENIIKYIESIKKDKVYLMETTQICNIFEFSTALKLDHDVARLEYLSHVGWLERELGEGTISGERYNEELKELQGSGMYQEYLYFRDTFKIINHLTEKPEGVCFRKLPVMMVDKNYDGTYYIHGGLTCKYPEFDDILDDVISQRSSGCERAVLIVDRDEMLDSVRDIDDAVFGFAVSEDSVEIFGKYEAVQLFGEALREAYYSGRCTVSGEFY